VVTIRGARHFLHCRGASQGGSASAYAACGGVYIVAAIVWQWLVQGALPDRWDVIGGIMCLGGAAIILLAPRTAG
jgi:drug/metabolite transporter superfamily protein YnfA